MLQLDINTKQQQLSSLEDSNKLLMDKVQKLEDNLDEIEQYSRKDNLVISGIPSSYAEAGSTGSFENSQSTIDKVIDICNNKLGLHVSNDEISSAHRLKPKRGSTAAPIIVRFSRSSSRDTVFHARFQLKDFNHSSGAASRIYINEDLTDHNRKLFAQARTMMKNKQLQSVWTSGCRILIKGQDGLITHVRSAAQLRQVVRVA